MQLNEKIRNNVRCKKKITIKQTSDMFSRKVEYVGSVDKDACFIVENKIQMKLTDI